MIMHIFYLTRTFAYYMHRAKMLSLGKWPGDPGRKTKQLLVKKPAQIRKSNHYDKNNSNQFVSGASASSQTLGTKPPDDPLPSKSTTLQKSQYQHIIADKNAVQFSSQSVSVSAAVPHSPGLHACGGAAGAGQGHGHAPEDHPYPTASPTDDL